MLTSDLDFPLPPDLIAQSPPAERTASRLLHYERSAKSIVHRTFADLPALLRPGDLLVFNDTKVIPARFTLRKPTGGHVEALFLAEPSPGQWRVMLKNAGAGIGKTLHFEDPGLTATITDKHDDGDYLLRLNSDEPALQILGRLGRMPLPPYIKRDKAHDPRDRDDLDRYQTVFANTPGAVAAPTAGLHFTPALLDELARRGVERTFVTLHVGLGTFKPVATDTLEAHAMHTETYEITEAAASALNAAKLGGRRIIAVGTTSARVLESQPPGDTDPFTAKRADTNIFIYPPYRWKHASAMITNFHLPRSTLIALVAAMMTLDEQRRVYDEAVTHRYRFFSYGDAMFID